MTTVDISKELTVTLKYYFEKQKKTKYFLESDILEAVTRRILTKKCS